MVTEEWQQGDGVAIAFAVLMIVLGLAALVLSLLSAVGPPTIVAWAMISGGLAHLAYALAAESAGILLWRLLIGLLYVVGGLYFLHKEGVGCSSLKLGVAGIFFAVGLLRIVSFFQSRFLRGAVWIFFDGLVTVVLAFLIITSLLDSSPWPISAMVGVNLCVSGVSRLFFMIAS